MKLVVLGDVFLELSTVVSAAFTELSDDLLTHGNVAVAVGGSAANLAIAATEHFADVCLAGCVGDDDLGDLLSGRLASSPVRALLRRKAGLPSGLAIYLRDRATAHAKGTRLLVVADPSALSAFDSADAAALREEVKEADFLAVDGYSLIAEPRRGATLELMDAAREDGVAVVYDVVPHDGYRTRRPADLFEETARADVVVIEARTLNAYAGLPWTHEAGFADAETAVLNARRLLPHHHVFLRFGIGNADETFLLAPDGSLEHYHTGYSETEEPRGFGDRLLAAELSGFTQARN